MLYGWLYIDYIILYVIYIYIHFKKYVILVGGIPTLLKNDGVRQLG